VRLKEKERERREIGERGERERKRERGEREKEREEREGENVYENLLKYFLLRIRRN